MMPWVPYNRDSVTGPRGWTWEGSARRKRMTMGAESLSFADSIRRRLHRRPEAIAAYLRAGWLAEAAAALREARRAAGLTQQEVAERLGTTQSAIARMENDFEGRYTLRRYIDYLLACGRVPLDIATEPIEAARMRSRAEGERES